MPEVTVGRSMVTLDTAPLERLDAMRRIGKTIEVLAAVIAPAHIDIGQRKHIEAALQLLVDQIFVEVEARSALQRGDK